LITKDSYDEAVRQYAAEFQEEAAEAVEEARIAEEQANPPLERWTTQAAELGTKMSSMLVAAEARVGTFKAMYASVDQVQQNFTDLNEAIEDGRLLPTARIMPTHSWKKTTKDGKHTTDQKGFRYFQDYCPAILKRGKSAVYQMLKDAKMPREKKDPDNSLGALVKRGAKSFVNLHKKLEDKDKKVSFDSFMGSVVTAARALVAADLATNREEADQPAATPASPIHHAQEESRPLPPSQGQAG
jgi:hypothetical protein